MSDKYTDAIEASKVITDDAAVTAAVNEILDAHIAENKNSDVYKFLFNCIDLTTLKTTDSPVSVSDFTERVNAFEEEHPELPNVAAICVYPNFAQVVRAVLEVSKVDIACVSGGFPASQTFPEVKVAETALAVDGGADEIDIVMNVGNFLDGDYEGVCDEIEELKAASRDCIFKVIL
ncbi:MAG: deoxyribose-phosphate aldolase, partial [Muribaculaceae bacterium]|nr:deoxyribose-phosphate aldolase [Muribaculaceae bacterium]